MLGSSPDFVPLFLHYLASVFGENFILNVNFFIEKMGIKYF